MGKFTNVFKKQTPAAPSQKEPEIETAVMLVQYEDGGSTVGFLNLEGVKAKRQATINDLYRMCSETLQQITTIRTADRVFGLIQQTNKPQSAPYSSGTPVEEKKVVSEEKKDEGDTAKQG